MTALLDYFHEAVTTTKDVERLKKLILQLAVQGKLIKQNPTDEPASELLKRIDIEKENLLKEKNINSSKNNFSIRENEKPYKLPNNWKWVKLGQVSFIKGGKRVPKGFTLTDSPTEFVYIRVTDMKNGTIIKQNLKYISSEVRNKIKKYIINKDDLYITIAGTIGEVGTIPEELDGMNLTENAGRIIFRLLDKEYLKYILSSDFVRDQFFNSVNKMAQPKLALKRIEETLIPIPPLNEQKRISEKIKELMNQCDEISIQIDRKQMQSEILSKNIFSRLEDHTNPSQRKDLRFALENIEHLCNDKTSINKLRNSILSLAIQGKLVEQNPLDVPVSCLLKKIIEEKNSLIKEKKIKKDKPVMKLTDEEKQYELPNSWEWVRFNSIIKEIRYGTSKKCNYDSEGTPVLRIPNISNSTISHDDMKYAVLGEKELEELKLVNKDLLLIRSNGSTSLVGRSAIISEKEEGFSFAGYLIRTRIFTEYIDVNYVNLILNSNLVRLQIELPIRTTSGVKNINSTEIGKLYFPLPPLNEQKRIVSKVNQLMKLCEKLENTVCQLQQKNEMLLDALLQKAFIGKEV